MNEYEKWADESQAAWMRRVSMFVAEKVMGWTRVCISTRPANEVKESGFIWKDKDGEIAAPWNWNPAELIADAWLVVEKMWEIGCFHIALIQTDDGYECDFDDMRDTHSAAADTAPLAISLAALKAVE